MKTCVVVATGEEARNYLADSLKSYGMEAVLLSSLGELRGTLETVPVCGILLELSTVVTASVRDKAANQDFLERYPCVKFRYTGEQVLIVGETLEGFLDKCRHFEPRVIRKDTRTERYLAVYLSADESFSDAEKTVTANVSENGCFVYSVRDWVVGSRVWLKFPDDHPTLLSGVVRSFRPWLNNKLLPGIGILIDSGDGGVQP